MYAKYFVLFAILFTGWFLRKINFIDDQMNHSLNKLIVYFAYPCLIVHNIGGIDMTPSVIRQFLIALVISLASFFMYSLVSWLYAKARKYPREMSNASELSMSLANDGFMGFPIALIFFGETGLLLMLAHNAAMNIWIYTYGMKLLRRNNRGQRKMTPHLFMRATFRFLLNPNILALIIGFIIGFTIGKVPAAVDEYLTYIGGVSTPMAMIFIGSSLSNYKLLETLRNIRTLEASAMKLIWLPLLTVGLVWFLPIPGVIKCYVVLGGAFPTGATAPMLAEQENQSVETASSILFVSTLFSMATIPLTINLIMRLFM